MMRPVIMWAAAAALAIGLGAGPGAGDARAEPVRIAYLSPSFDISDAWERVFWAMQGRLDEAGVEYEVQIVLALVTQQHEHFSPRLENYTDCLLG